MQRTYEQPFEVNDSKGVCDVNRASIKFAMTVRAEAQEVRGNIRSVVRAPQWAHMSALGDGAFGRLNGDVTHLARVFVQGLDTSSDGAISGRAGRRTGREFRIVIPLREGLVLEGACAAGSYFEESKPAYLKPT